MLAAELAASHPDTTGVLMMNEHAGRGFVAGLQQLGCRLPQDISVLALASSLDTASMSEPEMAVLISPADELGRLGVDGLIDQIDKKYEPLPQLLIGCAYSPGATMGPAPQQES